MGILDVALGVLHNYPSALLVFFLLPLQWQNNGAKAQLKEPMLMFFFIEIGFFYGIFEVIIIDGNKSCNEFIFVKSTKRLPTPSTVDPILLIARFCFRAAETAGDELLDNPGFTNLYVCNFVLTTR